jgi:hypothetical protein
LPRSSIGTTAAILDQLPLSYFDTEQRLYPDWSNWWYPTTRGLEVIMLDSGFRNVALELKRNAFYNYSHRRLMGRAEADPAQSDPGDQKHEHWVATEEPTSNRLTVSRFDRLLSRLPPPLQSTARRVRRTVRRLF